MSVLIICEKPSVAMSIAYCVGATEKISEGKRFYWQGGDYIVTNALGHLVGIGFPEDYGYKKWSMSDLPMIPGSSFKGKMRSLLTKQYAEGSLPKKPGDDVMRVRRLFGYMEDGKGNDKKAHTARLQFSDMFLKNSDELKRIGVPVTEVKFENTINRLTAVEISCRSRVWP